MMFHLYVTWEKGKKFKPPQDLGQVILKSDENKLYACDATGHNILRGPLHLLYSPSIQFSADGFLVRGLMFNGERTVAIYEQWWLTSITPNPPQKEAGLD